MNGPAGYLSQNCGELDFPTMLHSADLYTANEKFTWVHKSLIPKGKSPYEIDKSGGKINQLVFTLLLSSGNHLV